MIGSVFLDPAVFDGLDHAQIGALTLLLRAALAHEPRGCLPDDEAVLCEAAGYGVQLRAWRRVRRAVLGGWKRVADPADAGRALLLYPALAEPGFVQAAPALAPRPLDPAERRRERERLKKQRWRARQRAAALAGLSTPQSSPVSTPVSTAVHPMSTISVPEAVHPADHAAAAEAAENRAVAASPRAGAREGSTTASTLSAAAVHPASPPLARGRVEDSPSTSETFTTISTTTTGDNPAGARGADGKVVVVGGVSIAEAQDRAGRRVVAAFHHARRARFPDAPPPPKGDETLLSCVRQWFADGASEQLLVETIGYHMPRLRVAPSTIYVFRHSVAAAIAGEKDRAAAPKLPLVQAQAGGGVTLTRSLAPYLPKLLAAGIDAAALRSWFAPLKLREAGDRLLLLAPSRWHAKRIRDDFATQIGAALAPKRWDIDIALPSMGAAGQERGSAG